MKIVENKSKYYVDNLKIPKDSKNFVKNNIITFIGLKKIFNRESNFDYNDSKLLIQNYLSHKIRMMRLKNKKFQKEVQKFNEAVEMAKQLEINSNLDGDVLKKIELDYNEVGL